MEIKYKGERIDLKYTFNSFKYMEELDLGDLNNLEAKPFKIVGVTKLLLAGCMNHNPKVVYDEEAVYEVLDEVSEEGKLMELVELLMEELQKSSFFKNLQEKPQPKKVRAAK